MKILTILSLVVLLAPAAFGQARWPANRVIYADGDNVEDERDTLQTYAYGSLPTCDSDAAGETVYINNSASAGTCTDGGTLWVLCGCIDTGGGSYAWTAVGSGGGGGGESNTLASEAGGESLAATTPKVGIQLRMVAADSSDFDRTGDILSIDDTTWATDSDVSGAVSSHAGGADAHREHASLEESAEIDSDITTHSGDADAHREHASLEESAEIDSDITTHAGVADAHREHASLEESAEIDSDITTHSGDADAHREHASLEESSEIDSDITTHAGNTDAHHAQSHSIESHDTTATGTELNTLTDGSDAEALHTHRIDTAIRQCQFESGMPEACADATIVTTKAQLQACYSNNRRMCIIDSEIVEDWDGTANDQYGAIQVVPAAAVNSTTLFFTDRGRITCNHDTVGAPLTYSDPSCLELVDTNFLSDSVFRFINPRISHTTDGAQINYKIAQAEALADSGTSDTLTDGSQTWGTNEFTGMMVVLRKGGAGEEYRVVKSNTGTVLTVEQDWNSNPAASDTYEIRDPYRSMAMLSFDLKVSENNTPIDIEIINPELTALGGETGNFGALSFGGKGCANVSVVGGTITGTVAVDTRMSCVSGADVVTTGWDTGTEIITVSGGHGLYDGQAIWSSSGGAQVTPGRLYYVGYIDSTTFTIHVLKSDALAATNPVNLTSAHTAVTFRQFTPASVALKNTRLVSVPHYPDPVAFRANGGSVNLFEGVTFDGGRFDYSALATGEGPETTVELRNTIFYNPPGNTFQFLSSSKGVVRFVTRNVKVVGFNAPEAYNATDGTTFLLDAAGMNADIEFEFMDCNLPNPFLDVSAALAHWQADVRATVTTPLGCEFTSYDQLVSSGSDTKLSSLSANGHVVNAGGGWRAVTFTDGTVADTTRADVDYRLAPSAGATFENLQQNFDIGFGANQVPQGSLVCQSDGTSCAVVPMPSACAYIEDPVSSEVLESAWRPPVAVTVTEIWCETDAGTVGLDLDIDDGTPLGINGSDISCAVSTGTADSSFANSASLAADDRLDINLGTVTTATRLSVCWKYTVD